jgi:hypothetical protein
MFLPECVFLSKDGVFLAAGTQLLGLPKLLLARR